MAKKRVQESTPRVPVELVVSKDQAANKIQAQIDEGENLLSRNVNSMEGLEKLRSDEKLWDDFNKELLSRLFNTDEISKEYSAFSGGVFSMSPTFQERVEYVIRDIKKSLDRLRSILRRLELIPEPQQANHQADIQQPRSHSTGSDIFIVHGHDDGVKETLARFIEKLNLNPVILHEQPNEGRTIIEKFEYYSNVGFAMVILTADDFGGKQGTDPASFKPRARQNVILELGYFLGALGRNRVCALYQLGVELPSDITGVLYIAIDDQGAWKLQVAKEIKAAGIEVDLNNAI